MREYVFLLEYDRGVHPVRDAFIDHPEVVATALDISSAPDGGWRIERLTGPEHALDAIESAYFGDQCNDCTYPTPACDAQFEYRVLEHEPTARTIYRYVTDQSYCHAVSYLALETLGNGLVFDATQRGPYYEWRLLVPTEKNIDALHETLREELPDGISLDVRRIGTPDRWLRGRRPQYGTDLPYEQREAVETAISMGYYDYPREADLRDIAAELDLPLTTLRYRLRRGEAWATATALGGMQFATTAGSAPERTDAVSALEVPTSED